MGKMNPNAVAIYNYVKEHEAENITAADIAEALDLGIKSVNGTVTAAFVRHRSDEVDADGKKIIVPLMERIEGELEIEGEDGKIKHQAVKFIKLTDEGRAFNVEA